MLRIAKDRTPLVYTWPLPTMIAGLAWTSEIKVWDENGVAPALTGYVFAAHLSDGISDRILATADVSLPSTGTIQWTFAPTAIAWPDADTVYRFTLDAGPDGLMQRLVDARVPVRAGGPLAGVAAVSPGPGPDPGPDPGPGPTPPGPIVFPNAGNTGPTGTLVTMSGNIVVNVPGAIVENIRLSGSIDVVASEVTIRNCEINAAGHPFGIDGDGVDDLIVQNVRITGSGGERGIAIQNGGLVSDCDISGYQYGVRFGGAGLILRRNYIHNLTAISDCLQAAGCSGVLIEQNTLSTTGAGGVFLKTDLGPIADVRVLDNQFLGPPVYNVVVDIGSGSSVITDIEIARSKGVRGSTGDFDIDPLALAEVNIHDNDLT